MLNNLFNKQNAQIVKEELDGITKKKGCLP